MTSMFAASRYISPIVNIRRERTLPIPGKILVRRGQRVNAMDPIAERYDLPDDGTSPRPVGRVPAASLFRIQHGSTRFNQ